ncbi:MAG: cell division protein FtsA [Patescibacteria group bacterium]
MANFITGLDIGSSQIKCVVATPKKNGELSIVTAFKQPSVGLRKGVLVDTEEFSLVLREIANDLQKISRQATQNIFVNIQSEQVKPRLSRGVVVVARADQEIQQDDVDRAVQSSRAVKLSSNHLILHNITREFFVDEVGDITDPLGMTGSRLEVSTIIIEAFSPHINILVKSLERVGFTVGGLVFNPLAAAKSVLSKRQRDLGVLLIDFGFGTTSFAIYEENKMAHAKSLPVGSGFVSNDIAIGFKTPIDAAEKLKTTYGFALSKEISRREMIKLSEVEPTNKNEIARRFLSEIIEIRLAEILDLINNELKSLGRVPQLPAGVVITGGGVKLAGMTDLVKEEMKLPVQIGFPDLSNFEILNPTHQELLDDPEFASAVGLVLSAAGGNKKIFTGPGLIKQFIKNLIP